MQTRIAVAAVAGLVLLLTVPVAAQEPLTDAEVQSAIVRAKSIGGGLYLTDAHQGFLRALSPTQHSSGFAVRVHSPESLIASQAYAAEKAYLSYSIDDVDADDREPFLYVRADPDAPGAITAEGMVGTSGVQHVVILDTEKRRDSVIQPLSIGTYTETSQNAMGAAVDLVGLEVVFRLSDVNAVRCKDKKGEFRVNVIGTTGEEKSFKVKTKHFGKLGWSKKFNCPML